MSHKNIELEFRQSLEETDYGLIVGYNGELKGIWVPNELEGQDIPDAVVKVCVEKFGIDPNAEGMYSILQ